MNDDPEDKLIKTALGLSGAVGIGGVVLGIVVPVGRAAVRYLAAQAATDAKVLETLGAAQLELEEQSIVLMHLADRMGHPIGPVAREATTMPPPVVRASVDTGPWPE
jgi:hypothetical protein